MTLQTIIAILVCFTAFCSFINYRYIHLSPSLGITLLAFVFSTVIILLNRFDIVHLQFVYTITQSIDLNAALMGGLISFLLFAGSLHLNTLELAKEKWIIFSLATFGVLISTVLVGFSLWLVTQALGINFNFLDCLIFGALIAPTDPIAVMGILKKLSAPKALEAQIAGESLFNDGTGIVVFVIIYSLITGDQKPEGFSIAWLFAQQLVGGLLYGALLGFGTSFILRKVNDFHVSTLITVGMVLGGYLLALRLNVSGPIAVVMAGLIVGNRLRQGLMSEGVIRQLDSFWALVDEVLNAILFMLIGIELLKLPLTMDAAISAAVAIPIVLLSRLISVALPVSLFKPFRSFTPNTVKIMTWGGLRGGVSIALALSLQASPVRNEIITVTYAVVVFSLLVQGLTVGPLIHHLLKHKTDETH